MDLRTGQPYWDAAPAAAPGYPRLDRDEEADVAVVGSGVTGALVAERLTGCGATVVVVDRRSVARGSTLATTGLLLYDTDTSLRQIAGSYGLDAAFRVYQLGLEAVSEIGQLVATLDDDCGFSHRPSVYLASDRSDLGALEEEMRLREAHGFAVEWLAPAALRSRYGIVGHGGIHSLGNAQIAAARFTHALIRRATARGARVYDDTEAVSVERHDGRLRVTTAGGHAITVRRLVWATGYEGGERSTRRLGQRYSTWVLASEPLDDRERWIDGTLFWESARPYLYARLTDDGRVMAGGEDRRFHWWHQSQWLMQRKTSALCAGLSRWFPDLSLDVAFRWAGTFSATADGLPYIGETSGLPGRWLAFGYGGNGITFSLIAANLIRDAWLGRPNPDAALFRIDR